MNWEELGVGDGSGFVLDGGYRFEPSVTIKNGERIEVSYDAGKPYKYTVVGVTGEVKAIGLVLPTH